MRFEETKIPKEKLLQKKYNIVVVIYIVIDSQLS